MLDVVNAAVTVIEQIVVAGVFQVDSPKLKAEVGVFVRFCLEWISVIVMLIPYGGGGNKFAG